MARRNKKSEVVNRCIKNCTTWYWETNSAISLQRFNNACRSYAGNINPNDAIAITDETIFKNGKKGMLFTEDGVYYSTSMGGQYFSYLEPQLFENRVGYNCVALNEMIQELYNIEMEPSGFEILGGIIGKTVNFISELNELANDEMKDDEKNDNRILTFPDGAGYEGELKDGKFHGNGIYTFADGARYEGEWKNDKYNGKGTYTFADGLKYEGEWKDDKKNGKGTMTFASGARYEGEWKDNNYNGNGIWTYADGGKYEGEWKDDKKNGKGTMTSADGHKYEGEWKDDTYLG